MNEEKLEFLGITKFHECGYRGQGITILDREGNKSSHAKMVIEIINTIAPASKLLIKQDYSKNIEGDIYTTSLFFPSDKWNKNAQKAQLLNSKDVFLCCAVGNEAGERQSLLSKFPWWNAIGACELMKDKPRRLNYSSITEDIDFMSFSNMKTSIGRFTGTSCATPVFASMCALAQSFFKEKLGRKLTNKELLNFIQDNLIDLENPGFDENTGHGLFVLPDPNTIDINKYIEGEPEDMLRRNIKMKIGDSTFSVDGEDKQMDVEPFIKNNRTFVPIRFISEALGYEVIWNDKTKEIEIK